MERKYYTINEATARRAHNMMSLYEYKEGSKTADYRTSVDEAYDLAEKAIKKNPNRADDIYYLADRYAKKLAENYNKDSEIGCRCPSVLIAGPANFPARKKERQVAAWERNTEEYIKIHKYLDKIRSIANGSEIILSSDEMAIQKLEDKLSDLKKHQELMKAANKAVRLKNIDEGNEQLQELGFTDHEIECLRTPDWCGRIGYPNYELSNNNANIHRIEGRIKELQALKDKGTSEEEVQTDSEDFKVVRNSEAMRLQIYFSGKPEPEVREVLKKHGFRWAPSNGCWQRQLNNNAEYALKCITRELRKEA